MEHTLPAPAAAPVAENITPAPMEFVKEVLHEIDEDLCRDDLEELCYVARMSPGTAAQLLQTRQNLRGHGEGFRNVCVTRRGFDEMKRTCAYCGMFQDEDDILVRCQGPDCSLRSADNEISGVFHGRCAAASGHSGGARWQNCPWCPPTTFRAKPATVIGVDVSDEDENFISMTRLEEMNYAALTIQRGMEMDPQKDCASGRK